jgi:hypothetical protein
MDSILSTVLVILRLNLLQFKDISNYIDADVRLFYSLLDMEKGCEFLFHICSGN